MPDEKPEVELARLKKEQDKARRDEVFGGFSPAEREQFEARGNRIQTLQWNAALASSPTAEGKQQREWEKTSETDTHQDQARQSYRSRDKESE